MLPITEINKRSVHSCLHLYLSCKIRDFMKQKYVKAFIFITTILYQADLNITCFLQLEDCQQAGLFSVQSLSLN